MMWVPLDGFDMQTAGAIYVTHAVARLQRSAFLGRSAVVERAEELEKVLFRRWGWSSPRTLKEWHSPAECAHTRGRQAPAGGGIVFWAWYVPKGEA